MLRTSTCASQHCHWGVIRCSVNLSRTLTFPATSSHILLKRWALGDWRLQCGWGNTEKLEKKRGSPGSLASIFGVRSNISSLEHFNQHKYINYIHNLNRLLHDSWWIRGFSCPAPCSGMVWKWGRMCHQVITIHLVYRPHFTSNMSKPCQY